MNLGWCWLYGYQTKLGLDSIQLDNKFNKGVAKPGVETETELLYWGGVGLKSTNQM